jgi:hypothetical protein
MVCELYLKKYCILKSEEKLIVYSFYARKFLKSWRYYNCQKVKIFALVELTIF